MPVKHAALKNITFAVGTPPVNYELQLENIQVQNNTDDGEIVYTFVSDGDSSFVEEVDPDWSLSLSFISDWTTGGISEFLQEHDGEDVDFTYVAHTGTGQELRSVQWTGEVRVKAPSVGGDVRATERQEVTLKINGIPAFSRVEDES